MDCLSGNEQPVTLFKQRLHDYSPRGVVDLLSKLITMSYM